MYTVAPYRDEICLEVMRGPKESGFKDFRNHPTGKVKLGEYEMRLNFLLLCRSTLKALATMSGW